MTQKSDLVAAAIQELELWENQIAFVAEHSPSAVRNIPLAEALWYRTVPHQLAILRSSHGVDVQAVALAQAILDVSAYQPSPDSDPRG